MSSRTVLAFLLVAAVGLGALVYIDRTLAQPVAQMPMNPSGPMMSGGQQMPMGQMMGQMQQQIGQMTANLRAMRAQLDRINPDLLTAQERPMYEYLKLMQVQMETMRGWMGNAQGVMRQMPGPRR